MHVGVIGLGRMGMNMARRLLEGGHQVVAYNRSAEKTERLSREGAVAAYSLAELAAGMPPPRVAWLMLPAGPVVDEYLERLCRRLQPGDVVIDGGNTHYRDDLRRAEQLQAKGIHFVDVGVSGGIWGRKNGYCLMVGGERALFERLEPLFKTLAPPEGYLHCGPVGAGHFVKMIHNGIEYGMMQAYAEGFQIMETSPFAESLDFRRIAHLWNRGSVIRSWLLELAEKAFSQDPKLTELEGYVEDSGEGRWIVQQAVESGVPAPVITLSLMTRFSSRGRDDFARRFLAALRREFGGHAVRRACGNRQHGSPTR